MQWKALVDNVLFCLSSDIEGNSEKYILDDFGEWGYE